MRAGGADGEELGGAQRDSAGGPAKKRYERLLDIHCDWTRVIQTAEDKSKVIRCEDNNSYYKTYARSTEHEWQRNLMSPKMGSDPTRTRSNSPRSWRWRSSVAKRTATA